MSHIQSHQGINPSTFVGSRSVRGLHDRAAKPASRSSSSAPGRTGATGPIFPRQTAELSTGRSARSLHRPVLRRAHWRPRSSCSPKTIPEPRTAGRSACRCAPNARSRSPCPQRGEKREIVEMALQQRARTARPAPGGEFARSANCSTAWPICSASRRRRNASRSTTIRTSRARTRVGGMIVAGPGRFRKRRVPQVQHQDRPNSRRATITA